MRTARRGLLFDWGDTLMRNFPAYSGPMASWPEVACLPYAPEILEALSGEWLIALATNAADSDEDLIWAALRRTGLETYIERVFCYRQIGVQKPDPGYFRAVLDQLQLAPNAAVMVGDDYRVDVGGALQAGLRAVWLNEKTGEIKSGQGFTTIHSLAELPAALSGLFSTQGARS